MTVPQKPTFSCVSTNARSLAQAARATAHRVLYRAHDSAASSPERKAVEVLLPPRNRAVPAVHQQRVAPSHGWAPLGQPERKYLKMLTCKELSAWYYLHHTLIQASTLQTGCGLAGSNR